MFFILFIEIFIEEILIEFWYMLMVFDISLVLLGFRLLDIFMKNLRVIDKRFKENIFL